MIEPVDLPDWANIPAVAYGEGYRSGYATGYRHAYKELGAVFRHCFTAAGEDFDTAWDAFIRSMDPVDARRAWDSTARIPRQVAA